MEIKKENISAVTSKFSVTVSTEDVRSKIEQWLVKKAPYIKVAGFRAGKVPMEVIRQRYGDEAEKESVKEIVQETLTDILKKENLKPVVHPQYRVESCKRGEDLSFSLFADIAPKIELKDFKNLKIEKIICEITEKEFETAYQDFYSGYQKFLPVSQAASQGCLVFVALQTFVGAKILQALSGDRIPIQIDSEENEFLSVIAKALIGQKAGGILSLKHVLSKNFHDKKLEGKKIKIEVKVLEVHQLKKVEFNNAEAVLLGYKDVDAFKKKLRENLDQKRKEAIAIYRKRQVLDALENAYQFDVPESLIEEDFKNVWRYVARELAVARIQDDEDVRGKTDEEIAKEYWDVSNRRVRLGFVIDKIAEVEKIKLSKEQIQGVLAEEISHYPDRKKELIKFYNQHPQAINRLLTPLLEDLVVEKVVELASVQELKLNSQELEERLKDVIP